MTSHEVPVLMSGFWLWLSRRSRSTAKSLSQVLPGGMFGVDETSLLKTRAAQIVVWALQALEAILRLDLLLAAAVTAHRELKWEWKHVSCDNPETVSSRVQPVAFFVATFTQVKVPAIVALVAPAYEWVLLT